VLFDHFHAAADSRCSGNGSHHLITGPSLSFSTTVQRGSFLDVGHDHVRLLVFGQFQVAVESPTPDLKSAAGGPLQRGNGIRLGKLDPTPPGHDYRPPAPYLSRLILCGLKLRYVKCRKVLGECPSSLMRALFF
jgi:hypothetical protein